jgi:amino acid adenylation domain-containing protein
MNNEMDNSQTLHKLFELQAEKHPYHTAVVYNNRIITYDQLNQKANQLAHYLINRGMKPDTLVAVLFERSDEFLIAILGILKAGCAYIPLDMSHPYERIALILRGAGNPLLITSKAQAKAFSPNIDEAHGQCAGDRDLNEHQVLVLAENKNIQSQSTYNPEALATAQNLAYVIYTSGSTGTPKGVLIEQGAVINYASWFSQHCADAQQIDFSANPAFDFAITLYLVPLILGLTVVMCNDVIKKDPVNYLNYLKNNEIDFIKLTPSYFKVLVNELQNKPIKLPYLKRIMLGGENLSKAECEAWLSLYPNHVLYNEYGPTETTVAVTVFAIDKNNMSTIGENIPIGTLAPNTYAYILDEHLRQVTEGEAGELYIGGLCLARGYLNSQELTQKYFIKDPFSQEKHARLYKTGDLCRNTAEHGFECIGRIDHQLKIRGFRVEPDEVENHLATHPALKAAVVIACDHYQREKSLIGYYILKESNAELEANELAHYLKRYLPDYMIPVAFIRMDSFPLNANDKLDRTALPVPQFSASQYYLPPHTRVEKMLANIWSEELGIQPIGLHDVFFELGGHSLSAARIISKINSKFKKEISLQSFYEHPTIASIIPVIKKAKVLATKQKTLTKKLNNDSALFPLSDFQFMLWMANTFEPKAKKLNIFIRKRIQGRLDVTQLNLAFEALLHKHEVLSFHVSRFRPGQYIIKNSPFSIIEESLESLSATQREAVLEESVQQLIDYHPWPKNAPQIIIRLFSLGEEISELQLCIPHIISDDISPEIVLLDLAKFYTSSSEINTKLLKDRSYRNYLLEEQLYLKHYLTRDITFWDNYLKDAFLYAFPAEHIIQDMSASQHSYSTYLEIPQQNLSNLGDFCAKNHVSILDGLCAVVALALKNCTDLDSSYAMCINRVKSTRENRDYDNTIGCFLRIEPIKLQVHQDTTFTELSQDIYDAVMHTNPYQGCPNLVKLASIGSFRQQKKIIKNTSVKVFFWLYSLIFRTRLYYKVLRMIGRLNSIKGTNFLININVQSNFLLNVQKENDEPIFGFKEEKIPNYHYDLLTIDNLFDASFLRMPDSKNPFLVISANLDPRYREKVAKEMMRIMADEIPCEVA